MSAFQTYRGVYECDGQPFNWRCYATARIHQLRPAQPAPPPAPEGMTWMAPSQPTFEPAVLCLVDAATEDFSQILLQIAEAPAATQRRPKWAESAERLCRVG